MPKKVDEIQEPEVKQIILCGHVNEHAGLDAKNNPIVCSLEKGHKGNHRGKFVKKITLRKYSQTQPPRLISKSHEYKEAETDWSDAAGKVPTDFPNEIQPPSMAELEFGPEIGKQIVSAMKPVIVPKNDAQA